MAIIWNTPSGLLANVSKGEPVNIALSCSGADTFSVIAGSLPIGLTLTSPFNQPILPLPSIWGCTSTDASTGISVFTIRASDSNGNIVDRGFSLEVLDAEPSYLFPPSDLGIFPDGNWMYTTVAPLSATPNWPKNMTILSGSLPANLSLNAQTGEITGYVNPSILYESPKDQQNIEIGKPDVALSANSRSFSFEVQYDPQNTANYSMLIERQDIYDGSTNNFFGTTIRKYGVGLSPIGVAIDSTGNVWVANDAASTITKLNPNGTILGTFSVAGNGFFLAIDSNDNVWMSCPTSSTLVKLNSSGAIEGTFFVGGGYTFGVAIDSNDDVWVVNSGSSEVIKFNQSGANIGAFPVGTSPFTVAIDSTGNVWVTNSGDNTVSKLSSSGVSLGIFGVGLNPFTVAIDSQDNVWVTNSGDNTLYKLNSAGENIGVFLIEGTPTSAGLAIDSNDNVWVSVNNTVHELNQSGTVINTFTVGNGSYAIAISSADSVWVTNSADSTVTEIALSSTCYHDPIFLDATYGLNVCSSSFPNISLGVVDGDSIYYKFNTLDYEDNTIGYILVNGDSIPGNVVLNPTTGWLSGYINRDLSIPEPYEFQVVAYKSSPIFGQQVEQSGTFEVGVSPTPIASDQTGNIWVGNSAGNSIFKLSNSGSILLTAATDTPQGVAVDRSGNVWVSNFSDATVSKFDTNLNVLGVFSVGNGPYGVAVDRSGNIWVSNSSDATMMKLDESGNIIFTATVDTNPEQIAIDAGNNAWTVNTGDNTVTKVSSNGTVVGTFYAGRVPNGIAIDSSNYIWITDGVDNAVSKLDSSGTILATYPVGNFPCGIAISSDGHLWIVNGFDRTLVELNSAGVILQTFMTGITPIGITIDIYNNIWITNETDNTVSKFGSYTNGTYETTAFCTLTIENPADNSVVWNSPTNIGNLYPGIPSSLEISASIVDAFNTPPIVQATANCTLKVVGANIVNGGNGFVNGTIITVPGGICEHSANLIVTKTNETSSILNNYSVGAGPAGIAVDSTGNIWVVNSGDNTLSKFDSSAHLLGTFSVDISPYSIAIDSDNNVYSASPTTGSVTKLNSSGANIGIFSGFDAPNAIVIDSDNNILVANTGINTITKITPDGTVLETFTTGNGPIGIAFDSEGNIWVANSDDNTISKLNSDGITIGTFATGNSPFGIAIDSLDNVWVVNLGDNTLNKYNLSGVLIGTFITGNEPYVVTVDSSNNVWVVNVGGNTVTEFNTAGQVIRTIAVGNGPEGIAIDKVNNVWVTNETDNTVTKISLIGSIIEVVVDESISQRYTKLPAGLTFIWENTTNNDNALNAIINLNFGVDEVNLLTNGEFYDTATVGFSSAGETISAQGTALVYNGSISDIIVDKTGENYKAVPDVTILGKALVKPTNPIKYALTEGTIPAGCNFLSNGLIVGLPSSQYYTLDHNTIFDVNQTVFDTQFNFTITASIGQNRPIDFTESDLNGANVVTENFQTLVNVSKDFSLNLQTRLDNNITAAPKTNLSLEFLLDDKDIKTLYTPLQNESIISNGSIFRQDDFYFGIAPHVRMLLAYGISPEIPDTIQEAIDQYFHNKSYLFNGLKWAQSTSEGYEVIYIEPLDDFTNPSYQSFTGPVSYNTSDGIVEAYPATTPNMIQQLNTHLNGFDYNFLPSWMRDVQPDGQILGYVPAIPLVYLQPGTGKRILFYLQQYYNNVGPSLETIDAVTDRLVWNSGYSQNWDSRPVVRLNAQNITAQLSGVSQTFTAPSFSTYAVGHVPQGITIDSTGNVWVANLDDQTVSKLSSTGSNLGVFDASTPAHIAIDYTSNVWVTNTSANTVTKLSSIGSNLAVYTTVIGPQGITVDPSGNIWIVGTRGDVNKLSPNGSNLGIFPIIGDSVAIAIDQTGNVWVPSIIDNLIIKLSSTGANLGVFPVGSSYGVTVDKTGNVWVSNDYLSTITKLSSTGANLGTFATGALPYAVTTDTFGNVWVTNIGDDTVTEFNLTGNIIGTYAVGNSPYAIASGLNGDVWVVNSYSDSITKIAQDVYSVYDVLSSNGTEDNTVPSGTRLVIEGMTSPNNNGIFNVLEAISGEFLVQNDLGTIESGSGGYAYSLNLTANANFSINPASPLTFTPNLTPRTYEYTGKITVELPSNITSIENVAAIINSYDIPNIQAGVGADSALYIQNITGSPFILSDGIGTPLANLGLVPSSQNVSNIVFSVGANPYGIAIDPTENIWITNAGDTTVTKLSSAGTTLGTFAVGANPYGIAIDPTGNVWVAGDTDNTITKLSSDGTTLGTFAVGASPLGVVIDSSDNVWVTNYDDNTVTKLSSAGTTLGTFAVGGKPYGIAIDPTGNVWVTNYNDNTVTKLSSAGTTLGTFAVGGRPYGIAIDPTGNVWVAGDTDNTVTKLSSDGTTLGTFAVGTGPIGIAIDSSDNVWVTNYNDNTVTKLSSDGTTLGTFAVRGRPLGVVIDSLDNVWVTNYDDNTVTKLIFSTLVSNIIVAGWWNAETVQFDQVTVESDLISEGGFDLTTENCFVIITEGSTYFTDIGQFFDTSDVFLNDDDGAMYIKFRNRSFINPPVVTV